MRKIAILLWIVASLLSACQKSIPIPESEPQNNEVVANDIEIQPAIIDGTFAEDEKAIVAVLNMYIESGYKGDYSNLPVLKENAANYGSVDFRKVITKINKVDFDHVPKPTNENEKNVIVEYEQILFNPRGSEGIKSDEKQLFTFKKEDGEWKYVATADYWEGNF